MQLIIKYTFYRPRDSFLWPEKGFFLGFPKYATLAVIATDAVLTKEESNKLAQMAHHGLARALQPIHSLFDGDTAFAFATGKQTEGQFDVSILGTVGASVLTEAVIRVAHQTTSRAAIPADRDW